MTGYVYGATRTTTDLRKAGKLIHDLRRDLAQATLNGTPPNPSCDARQRNATCWNATSKRCARPAPNASEPSR